MKMQIVKRNGKKEEVKFDKILQRVQNHCQDLKKVDPVKVAQKVVGGLFDGISSSKIDDLLAQTSHALSDEHPDYGILAGRIAVSSLHKETKPSFYQTMKDAYKDGVLADDFIEKVKKYQKEIEKAIDYDRDYLFDYFGFKTLAHSYLIKSNKKVIERPQHLFMRVAIAVSDDSWTAIKESYELFSKAMYTHATPTLFNAGYKRPQFASCFLLKVGDSIDGIFEAVREAAQISKYSGGIGMHATEIRAQNSRISGNNGISNGLVPWMKIFNETARAVNQGGKRPGSIAVYLEPWHADVESFLELKKKLPPEELRAKDLFLAMWCPSLFFERCEKDENWSLFCPKDTPELPDAYGDKFNELYEKYEKSGVARKTMKARDLLAKIVEVQIEHAGVPYMLNKDMANLKSNQKNLGTIRSSNLCTEIIQYSDDNETAVCNLSSVILWSFLQNGKFNFDKLEKVVRKIVRNLNNVIDRTFYPTEKTKKSNLAHRPMGIGVQGLADVFNKLKIPFDSEQAINLDKEIFETIYFAALSESVELAKKQGSYSSFKGSPASEGILQFDMWNEKPSERYEWDKLKKDIIKHGLRNSLFIAPMPTASTAQIFGSTEAFEPIKGVIYRREVSAGDFIVVNRDFVKDMEKLGLWSLEIKNKILRNNGSIQSIAEIPEEVKNQYRCAHEVSQKWVIDHAAARGIYIDQSQSMNLFFDKPTVGKVSSALMHAYKRGLKTLSYYIRTEVSAKVGKVGLEDKKDYSTEEALACSLDNPENCEVCSS